MATLPVRQNYDARAKAAEDGREFEAVLKSVLHIAVGEVEGFAVPLVVVLVDREEGGRAALEAAGVSVVSVCTRGEFVSRGAR